MVRLPVTFSATCPGGNFRRDLRREWVLHLGAPTGPDPTLVCTPHEEDEAEASGHSRGRPLRRTAGGSVGSVRQEIRGHFLA